MKLIQGMSKEEYQNFWIYPAKYGEIWRVMDFLKGYQPDGNGRPGYSLKRASCFNDNLQDNQYRESKWGVVEARITQKFARHLNGLTKLVDKILFFNPHSEPTIKSWTMTDPETGDILFYKEDPLRTNRETPQITKKQKQSRTNELKSVTTV